MHLIVEGLYHSAAMLWEMLWALVLGFAVSAILQVFVSKERMARAFGKSGWREVLLAAGFGAASSSCSYAAAATMKTVFKKGAAFIPALAFLIASTNLVVELGIVMWMLLGWRFVLAELIGAFVMIAVTWMIFALFPLKGLIRAARSHSKHDGVGSDHHGSHAEKSKAFQVAEAFIMDWSMLWKEILIGVCIAGFLMALVPKEWWQRIFLTHGSHPVRLFENALMGPLVAMASFVCSIGNIPLAGLLWSSGTTFGGVIAFIYGDLLVLPLILIYRKYYGTKMALYLSGLLFAAMVSAGILVDLLFASLGLMPPNHPGQTPMAAAGFSWNYTTWLNITALAGGGWLLYLWVQGRHKSRAR